MATRTTSPCSAAASTVAGLRRSAASSRRLSGPRELAIREDHFFFADDVVEHDRLDLSSQLARHLGPRRRDVAGDLAKPRTIERTIDPRIATNEGCAQREKFVAVPRQRMWHPVRAVGVAFLDRMN